MSNPTSESESIDTNKIPKNQLEKILERLLKIDISEESTARVIKKDLMLAQCLANIDRFGHPNPNQPAKANGETFVIRFITTMLPEIKTTSKRSILEFTTGK